MCPTEIELQREFIQDLKEHIEKLQGLKERIAIELAQLTVSKLLLQITKKSPELLARIETHINEGNQYESELAERIASRQNLYQRLQFFTQINNPLPARSESVTDSLHSSSLQQEMEEVEKAMRDTMTLK